MKEDLKRKAIPITVHHKSLGEVWMYEDPSGLQVYANCPNDMIAKIPLSTIRAYIRRLDKGREE